MHGQTDRQGLEESEAGWPLLLDSGLLVALCLCPGPHSCCVCGAEVLCLCRPKGGKGGPLSLVLHLRLRSLAI